MHPPISAPCIRSPAGCSAVYTLWDFFAVAQLHVELIPYIAMANLAQAALLTVVMWGRRSEMHSMISGRWRQAAPVALLVPLSYGLVLVAMQHASPSLVATTRNFNIVFGVLAGVVLLRERPTPRAWVGVLVITAGALLAAA